MNEDKDERKGLKQKGNPGAESVIVVSKPTSRSFIVLRECVLCQYALLRLPSDPSTVRILWEGEASSGGVPVHLPASSSPPGDTSWPMRTLSKLPSPTPFPSHRPHGNLKGNKTLYIQLKNVIYYTSTCKYCWVRLFCSASVAWWMCIVCLSNNLYEDGGLAHLFIV